MDWKEIGFKFEEACTDAANATQKLANALTSLNHNRRFVHRSKYHK